MKTLNLIAPVLSALLISACSTTQKHSFSADADPAKETAAMAAEIETMRTEQYDVMAPRHFAKAEKAVESAKKQMRNEKERTAILNTLEEGKKELGEAKIEGTRWKEKLPEVVDARQKALAAGAVATDSKEMASIDTALKDLTEEPARETKISKEGLKFQERYMKAELKATQKKELGQARDLVKAAQDENARRYAPESLKKAETAITSAERQIEANRNNPEAYREAVTAALGESRKLLSITIGAKEARNKTPEQIALAIRDRENQILNVSNTASNLAAVGAAQAGQLQSQTAALAAERQKSGQLAREAELVAKMKEIESQFDKSEADVYRQGDSVVVRLKSMQFPSARADLPAKSLPTLAKVKSAIEELGAQKVVVQGHTDAVGAKEINQKLSEERATAVSQYLVSQNAIADANVSSEGFGFDRPITSNKTAQGRAQNRRVDVIITPAGL